MSHRTHRFRTALVLAASMSALATPVATAAPAEQLIPGASRAGDEGEVPVRVVSAGGNRGFDWGDAGIGATGVLALALMSGGVALATGIRVGRVSAP